MLTPETDPQSGAVVLYPVRLRDSLTLWEREQLDLYVELSNQRTGQKQRVPVYVKLVGQKPDLSRKLCHHLSFFYFYCWFFVGSFKKKKTSYLKKKVYFFLRGCEHVTYCKDCWFSLTGKVMRQTYTVHVLKGKYQTCATIKFLRIYMASACNRFFLGVHMGDGTM